MLNCCDIILLMLPQYQRQRIPNTYVQTLIGNGSISVGNKTCLALLGVLLLGTVLVIGCAGKEGLAVASDGNTVKVHYTGTLEDGTTFDTSLGREPLEFTLGEGRLIPGFEEAVKGMQVGQSKTVMIPSEDAYGPHLDDLVLVLEREQIPENMDPAVGEQLQMQRTDGSTIVAIVIDVSEATVTVDANHPLAGKDLTFEIELVEIK